MARVQGFVVFESAIGACALAWSARGLAGVWLPDVDEDALRRRIGRRFPAARESEPPADARAAVSRVVAVLQGGGDDLADVALDLERVPDFEQRVYAAARAVPPGATCTYGDLAARIGEPHAARAVGRALARNPFPIVVPCHRVLAAGGRAGGFSAPGGLRTKLALLEIERAPLAGAPGLFDAP